MYKTRAEFAKALRIMRKHNKAAHFASLRERNAECRALALMGLDLTPEEVKNLE